MSILMLFQLFGGLAFFLYGMNIMSTGLEKMTGGKLERALKKVTDRPIKSLLFGAFVTIAIQSSSAMTVMLVGFVNSGIMELSQTIGIIMGSNIGTTLTAWILSLAGISSENVFIQMLNPENFSPVIAFVGVLLIMISKSKKRKDIGNILLGFSVLMFGMTQMSAAVSPLADIPEFSNILVAFKNPILGVLVGAVFTGIIQSSAASVGILQALSLTGNITFQMAMPIIMGQNIGTCVTALLSSIGVNRNAKRVAVVHIYFNIIGTVFCLVVFYGLHAIIHFTFVENTVGPVTIAMIHSIFNIITTMLLLPFTKGLEYMAVCTVKNKEKEENDFLDERLLATPSVAIAECRESMIRMTQRVKDSYHTAHDMMNHFQSKQMEVMEENERKTDEYEDKLGTYLVKLNGTALSDQDGKEVSKILHMLSDVERIGDHALKLSLLFMELSEKKLKFSDEAEEELENLLNAVGEIVESTFEAYAKNDIKLAKRVEPLEQVIHGLCNALKETHIKRLQDGTCSIEQGFIFRDILENCQRISAHCSNIAVCVIRISKASYDAHEYLQDVKENASSGFQADLLFYHNKYGLGEVI